MKSHKYLVCPEVCKGALHRLAHPLGLGVGGGAVVQVYHGVSPSCSMRRSTRMWFSHRMRSAASAP